MSFFDTYKNTARAYKGFNPSLYSSNVGRVPSKAFFGADYALPTGSDVAGTIGKVDNAVPSQGFQWGSFGDILGGIGTLAQGLMGIGSAYTGYKNYKLAKEAFGFEKALAQRNLANQAQLINNAIDASANVSSGLNASMLKGSAYNDAQREQILTNADKTKVSGTL